MGDRLVLRSLPIVLLAACPILQPQPLGANEFAPRGVSVESSRGDEQPQTPPNLGRTRNSAGEIELRRYKQQALQRFSVAGGLLSDTGSTGVSTSSLEVSLGSGLPLGSFDNLLGIEPSFRVDWVDAAPRLDVPAELYQFELQFFYRRAVRERLSLLGIVSPSIRSDLTTDEDAFRLFALGLLNWECVPDRLTLSAGAVSLGRADLPVLPALGLRWTPSARKRLELQFPRSRFAWRLAKQGGESELWSYLCFGIGGNTWAVTRRDGTTDELSLGDLRLTVGLERLVDGGGGCFLETGAALNRELESERDGTTIPLGDAFVLQAGWRY